MSYDPYTTPEQPYQQPPMPPQAPKISGFAITALVLGILGFLCLLFGIPAVIFGHIARASINKSNGQITGAGMALAGLICGYVFSVLHIAWIIFNIMNPGFFNPSGYR